VFYTSKKVDVLPAHYYWRLKGKLGDNIFITMEISKSDSILTGYYYYDKFGKQISLNGKIKKTGSFEMEEYNNEGKNTGKFIGKISLGSPISGTWKNMKGDKSFPFVLNSNLEGAAGVLLKSYVKENCERIEKIKNNPAHEASSFDSSCSVHTLILPIITLQNKSAEKAINESILNSFLGSNNGRRNSIEEHLGDVYSDDGNYYMERSEFFSVSGNDKNILCLRLNNSEYYEGAAHGMYGVSMLTFDLNNGKKISMKDLFLPNTENALNQLGEKLFYETNGKEDWFFAPGEFKLTDNFGLRSDGITFIYNPYEIGPYSAGAPEVFIPYTKLSAYINPNGILPRYRITKP
jgi:Protein of unknown function (DUF3298)